MNFSNSLFIRCLSTWFFLSFSSTFHFLYIFLGVHVPNPWRSEYSVMSVIIDIIFYNILHYNITIILYSMTQYYINLFVNPNLKLRLIPSWWKLATTTCVLISLLQYVSLILDLLSSWIGQHFLSFVSQKDSQQFFSSVSTSWSIILCRVYSSFASKTGSSACSIVSVTLPLILKSPISFSASLANDSP